MGNRLIDKPSYLSKSKIDVESMMKFDGVDDYVLLSPDPSKFLNFTNTDNFSISVFAVKITTDNSVSRIFEKEQSGVTRYLIELSDTLSFRFTITSIGGTTTITTVDSYTVKLNTVYHLCVTFEGNGGSPSTVKMYINGVLTTQSSIIIGDFSTDTGLAYIGRNNINNRRYEGFLSNFSIYNKVLTQSEVKVLHRWGGYIPVNLHENIIAYYPLNNRYGHKRNLLNINTTSTTTATAQVAHGLSVGDLIWNNGGTWELSDYTNPSEPPTIVSAVTDLDNFTRATKGLLTISAHGLGNTGDLLYLNDNGITPNIQTTPTNYLIGEVIDGDTIRIATELKTVTVDEVERFNYAKTIPLIANHGEVSGYTDDEFGITPSLQETNYDFYDNSKFNIKSGIVPNNAGESNYRIIIPNNSIFDFGTDDIELEFEFQYLTVIGGLHLIFEKRTASGVSTVRLQNTIEDGFANYRMSFVDVNGDGIGVIYSPPSQIQTNKTYNIIIKKQTPDENNFAFIIDGIEIPTSEYTYQTFGAGWNDLSLTSTVGIILFNHTTNNDGRHVRITKFRINIANTDVEEFHFNNNSGLTTIGRINGSIATTTTIGRELIGGGLWLEEKSSMPEIKEGLDYTPDKSIVINTLNPPRNDGYTWLWEFYNYIEFVDTNKRLFQAISGSNQFITIANQDLVISAAIKIATIPLSNFGNILFDGTVNKKITLIIRVTDAEVSVILSNNNKFRIVTISSIVADLNPNVGYSTSIFGDGNDDDTDFNCKILRFGLWNRALSNREMIDLSKSANNPTIVQRKNLQVYYQFQQGSLYFDNLDDGTDLYVRNLAPASEVIGGDPTIWDAKLEGYNNIADARNNCTTLDSLEERTENILAFTVEGSPSFDPAVSMNNGQTVTWDYGDGTTEQSNIPVKVYGDTADYEVKMYGKLSAITNVTFNSDEIKDTLDLSKLTNCTFFNINSNPLLQNIRFGTSNAIITLCHTHQCDIQNLDLSGLNNLSGDIRFFNNPNLTSVTFPSTSQVITKLLGYSCDLTGNLDVSTLTGGNLGDVQFYNNPNLTGFIQPSVSTFTDNFRLYDCDLTGNLNLSNIDATGYRLYGNVNLTGITHIASSTRNVNNYSAYDCNLTGTLDLSTLSGLSGSVILYSNPNLTTILNPINNNTFVFYWAQFCNLTQLDLSTLSGLSGSVVLDSNPNLTTILNPTSVGIFTAYRVQNCNLTGTLDLSTLSGLSGSVKLNTNPNLTTILNPTSVGIFTEYWAYSCDLNYVDFSTLSNFMEVNTSNTQLQNNLMVVGGVNAILADIDSVSTNGFTGRIVQIDGTNDAPDNGINVAITGVDQTGGAGSNFFTIAGDQTNYFPVGVRFVISGSTGNNGTYTVVSASFTVNTDIIVEEVIVDATVDGTLTTADGLAAKASLQGKNFTVTTN